MLRAELALRWRPLEAGEAEQPLARWGATFTPLTTTQVLAGQCWRTVVSCNGGRLPPPALGSSALTKGPWHRS